MGWGLLLPGHMLVTVDVRQMAQHFSALETAIVKQELKEKEQRF